MKKLEVLTFSIETNQLLEIHQEGIEKSFLLSVDNETSWEPIIKSSTRRCYDDHYGTTDGYQCGVIPNSLSNVINCCYKENFLKCPNYNPNRISECKETYEFVELCYENDDYIL